MFVQSEYIREAAALTLNSTYTQELPKSGLLSAILIRITGPQVSGYGQSGADWRIVDEISKIEIIANGALLIKSIRGTQLHALAFFDQFVTSPEPWRNYATNDQRAYFLLNFGRFLYDGIVGLDLSKFNTVEIKITNTATASDFSALTVSLLGIYLREPGEKKFLGYMRSEEWRNYASVQNRVDYFELPTEHLLRRILLQVTPDEDNTTGVDETTLEGVLSDIDLSFDTGLVRVYKGGIDDLVRQNYFHYRSYALTGGQAYMSADRGIRVGLGYVDAFALGSGAQDGAGSATVPTFEGAHTGHTMNPQTYEADSPIQFLCKGQAYQGCAVLNFDYDLDPATWLDPNKRKTVLLNLTTADTASAPDATVRVILDRLVRY